MCVLAKAEALWLAAAYAQYNVLSVFLRESPHTHICGASGVIGKTTKFGFEWKWPLMGKNERRMNANTRAA
jgi:hypothetical protein